jgi:putative membrane protein
MQTAIIVITILIALLHCYFLWLEMFAWLSRGPKAFTTLSADMFPKTKVLAANQGLYNGFLAAGLLWSICISDITWSHNIGLFFASCVAIAGIYGAYSVHKKVFFIQAIPALIVICLILLSS